MATISEYQRRFNTTDAEHTSEFQKAMDAHRAQADQLRDNVETAVERIAGRNDLTPQAKLTAAARIYQPAAERVQQLLDEHIAKVNQHKQQLAQKAFGSERAVDPQTASMRREARRLAAAVEDKREAEQMIRDAQFDGDEHLARAAAAVAFERGWHDVVDVWGATNQKAIAHLMELTQLPDTNDREWRISTAASYGLPMPGLLDGLKPHEISRAAEAPIEVQG